MEKTSIIPRYQVAEIQLSYRSYVEPSDRPKIGSSKDAYDILFQGWDMAKIQMQEQFKVLVVNRAHRVQGLLELSTGGISGTIADPKLIFAAALKSCASGFIVAHNHPSGNLTASHSDIDLTRKLKEGGKVMEIQLLDHIIVTTKGYFSFADQGLL